MSDELQKIQSLIDSGLPDNIELAFALMHSTGLQLPMPSKEDFVSWIISSEHLHREDSMAENLQVLLDDQPLSLDKAKQALISMSGRVFLYLDMEGSEGFPTYIRWLRQLNSLHITSHTAIQIELPEWLSELPHLKSIDFQGNIELVGNSWAVLQSFAALSFSENSYIQQFPSAEGNWAKLEELSIENCGTKQIHLDFLPALSKLSLSKSKLRQIPIQLHKNAALSSLSFMENKHTDFGNIWEFLPELQKLSFHNEKMSRLPEGIQKLKKLISLTILQQKKLVLPSEIEGFEALRELYLGYNGLKELPQNIGNLRHLQVLSLHNNPLTLLPESIANLQNLEALYFSATQIRIIPTWIGQLQQLKKLSIHNNNLRFLPAELLALSKLERLEISKKEQTEPLIAAFLPQLSNKVEVAEDDDLPF